jgi:hypothetical protein
LGLQFPLWFTNSSEWGIMKVKWYVEFQHRYNLWSDITCYTNSSYSKAMFHLQQRTSNHSRKISWMLLGPGGDTEYDNWLCNLICLS